MRTVTSADVGDDVLRVAGQRLVVIEQGHNPGIQGVGDGMETRAAYTLQRELGCDEGKGPPARRAEQAEAVLDVDGECRDIDVEQRDAS